MLKGFVTAFGTLLIIIVILYLAYICTKYIAKNAGARQFGGGSRYIKIIDRAVLGQDSSVVIARVSGRVFLLGVSQGQVSMLTELDGGEFEDFPDMDAGFGQGVDFKEIIGRIRDRKK